MLLLLELGGQYVVAVAAGRPVTALGRRETTIALWWFLKSIRRVSRAPLIGRIFIRVQHLTVMKQHWSVGPSFDSSATPADDAGSGRPSFPNILTSVSPMGTFEVNSVGS